MGGLDSIEGFSLQRRYLSPELNGERDTGELGKECSERGKDAETSKCEQGAGGRGRPRAGRSWMMEGEDTTGRFWFLTEGQRGTTGQFEARERHHLVTFLKVASAALWIMQGQGGKSLNRETSLEAWDWSRQTQ